MNYVQEQLKSIHEFAMHKGLHFEIIKCCFKPPSQLCTTFFVLVISCMLTLPIANSAESRSAIQTEHTKRKKKNQAQ